MRHLLGLVILKPLCYNFSHYWILEASKEVKGNLGAILRKAPLKLGWSVVLSISWSRVAWALTLRVRASSQRRFLAIKGIFCASVNPIPGAKSSTTCPVSLNTGTRTLVAAIGTSPLYLAVDFAPGIGLTDAQ